MPWRQFYGGLTINPIRANAHLHNDPSKPCSPKARLFTYPWGNNNDPFVEVEIFRTQFIGCNTTPEYISAIIEPTFPVSLISRDIAEKLGIRCNAFITSTYRDIFGHQVNTIGPARAAPLFRGDNSNISFVDPCIIRSLGAQDWEILPDTEVPWIPFVLIGANILQKIVTVMSKDWIMIGADENDNLPPCN